MVLFRAYRPCAEEDVMEAVSDFTWLRDIQIGKIVERFDFGNYRVVALRIPETESHPHNQFHFRILFFPDQEDRPVLTLNLESSILGSYCLTEQAGSEHVSLGHADETMTYPEFKRWAMDFAEQQLQ